MYKVEYDRFAQGYLVINSVTDTIHSKWTNRIDALLCARDINKMMKREIKKEVR